MSNFLDTFIWGGLLALGIQFLYIGYRVRFDRTYGFFGASALLLASAFLGEGWPLRYINTNGTLSSWTYFSFLMASLYLPLLLSFIFEATQSKPPKAFRVFCAADATLIGIILCAPFIGRPLVTGTLRPSLAIVPLLSFPILALVFFMYVLIIRSLLFSMRAHTEAAKSPLVSLAIGASVFTLGCAVDLLAITFAWPVKGLAFKGAGAFAALTVYFLMHRFLSLHRANKNTLDQLAAAYAALGESAKLKELGTSTASITHEIRNFAAALKGNAILMGRKLPDEQYRGELDRIRSTAERMEYIAKDVAVYARASMPIVSKPVALDQLLQRCISNWFPEQQHSIHIHASPVQNSILGDAFQLEQVFVNFIRNSLEASSHSIDIRLRTFGNKLVVAIEDDGTGCPPEDVEQIAKPFFTKKSSGGTGLGCSIAESILKNHKASLRFYSKNALAVPQTGMILNLVFPNLADKNPSHPAIEIPVLSLDTRIRSDLVQPLIHLGINPILLPTEYSFLSEWELENERPVFLDPLSTKLLPTNWKPKRQVVVGTNRTARWMSRGGSEDKSDFLFTEESLTMWIEESFQV